MTDTSTLDIPERKPKFKVVKTLGNTDEPGNKSTLLLVKLRDVHIARMVGKLEYVEVKYVLVGIAALDKEDENGSFHYEETAVTASDKSGEGYESYLYFANRALTLEEAMFAIGEI